MSVWKWLFGFPQPESPVAPAPEPVPSIYDSIIEDLEHELAEHEDIVASRQDSLERALALLDDAKAARQHVRAQLAVMRQHRLDEQAEASPSWAPGTVHHIDWGQNLDTHLNRLGIDPKLWASLSSAASADR